MARRSASEMLLRLLNAGGRIEHEGYEYAMAADGQLCVVMRDDKGVERPIAFPLDMSQFKKLADDIGRDELWLQCCMLNLTEKRA